MGQVVERETVMVLSGRGMAQPRVDLWDDLNRVRRAAWRIHEELRPLLDAVAVGDDPATNKAWIAVEDAMVDVKINALADELLSAEASDESRSQAHDPARWDALTALLGLQRSLVTLHKARLGPLPSTLGALAKQADDDCVKVAHTALKVTAGSEAVAAMQARAIGAAIPLDELFDELKGDPTAQQELAKRLDHHEGRLFVDTERCAVYKKSGSRSVRVATYLAPLAWAGIGAAVVALAPQVVGPDPFWTAEAGLRAFALVLAGVVAHVLVTSQKQRQSKLGAPLPLGSPLDWLHTRWASVGLTVLWAVVAVIALPLLDDGLVTDGNNLARNAAALCFFAGFSLDSFVGIFLTRFDVFAEKGVSSMENRLKR